jgi:hypothetical protein
MSDSSNPTGRRRTRKERAVDAAPVTTGDDVLITDFAGMTISKSVSYNVRGIEPPQGLPRSNEYILRVANPDPPHTGSGIRDKTICTQEMRGETWEVPESEQ